MLHNVEAADDTTIADLESKLKMKRDVRANKYVALNDKRSKVGMGVAGDPAYGNDSPLYGAMGVVPISEKKPFEAAVWAIFKHLKSLPSALFVVAQYLTHSTEKKGFSPP